MTDLESLEFVARHAPIPASFDVCSVKRREFETLARVRGIQALCLTCANPCKVLRASRGLKQKFSCFQWAAK